MPARVDALGPPARRWPRSGDRGGRRRVGTAIECRQWAAGVSRLRRGLSGRALRQRGCGTRQGHDGAARRRDGG